MKLPYGRSGTSPLLLSDADVRIHLDAPTALAAVRRALVAHHEGALVAPARLAAELGRGSGLVFTAGQLAGECHGFRVYGPDAGSEQLVALWDSAGGRVRALVTGHELGVRRTGAIGAVAADLWARPDARTIGLVGAGTQAWAQLWAIRSVRELAEAVVFSRRQSRARLFAARAERAFGIPVRVASVAREAVLGRDVVILATSSAVPVIEASWLSPGTHVNTLGAKGPERSEVPFDLAVRLESARTDLVCTDSRAQLAALDGGSLFDPSRTVELGAAAAGAHPGRTADDQVTLFCSVGLAGTEVVLAQTLAERCERG
ncbi:ornithine cyclodeaminase family protein [Streptacidiphilus sp. EB103A]|uniref:ornithine cyclodeaminase family protein n=1 Tax=Streptacidiphilus sp. EB103A TaxID=3156275 RepID=UPI003515DEB4